MNPYEALANAIIQQAANDHRRATKFLKTNPKTEELVATVTKQIRERKARIKVRRENDEPAVAEEKTAEEKLLSRIMVCESLVKDTESFFRSDWFSDLTELDGVWLLEKLKKMEEEQNGC